MSSAVNHSMPIKQSYHSHIRESKEHPKNEIMYEFLDDYSYRNSKFSLVHLKRDKKGKPVLYVASEKGPIDIDTLNKIVKWRVSGESEETGHRGGGNKRFIYGHEASKVSIACKINDEDFIRLELSPNDIYELSENPDISEGDFQKKVDRDYIKWASMYDLEEDGAWFTKYLQEVGQELGNISYVIRFNLTEVPFEYEDPVGWAEFISTIQMKNYQIPIHFKNELLDINIFNKFQKFENIDLIGWSHQEPNSLKILEMYVDKVGNPYLKYQGKYRDSKNKEISYNEDWKLHSNVYTYRIEKDYFNTNHSMINKINKRNTTYTNEDFYGIYIRMNGKQTNYKPISNIIVPSKSLSSLGNSYFRLVIDPVCDNKTLDSFITTDTIKAKTRFKDTAKAKAMTKTIVDICKPPKEVIPKPVQEKQGLCYIVFLGRELYKFGHIEDYTKIVAFKNGFQKNGLSKLNEYYQDEDIMEDDIDFKILYFSHPIKEIMEFTARINTQFTEDNSGNIMLLDTPEKETGKYFYCEDRNYLLTRIIPDIFSYQMDY